MAVTFISKDSENTLLIGGQSAMGGATSGGVGPFPRYSIGREEIATGDGTYINTKHTINITGTATLKTGDSQDMLTAGQRQMRVQGEAIIKMRFNRDEWPMHGAGKLTISSYGGAGNDIVFNDIPLLLKLIMRCLGLHLILERTQKMILTIFYLLLKKIGNCL